MRRVARVLAVLVLLIVVAAVVAGVVIHQPRPVGTPDESAEALTRRIERAVNLEAWERIGALRFRYSGRNTYLWDRRRERVRVRWKDIEVLLRIGNRTGRAWEGGEEAHGARARELVDGAFARFTNDVFWLNPIATFRNPGVTRATTTLADGRHALLVSYASGGVTPGDAYAWLTDANGTPTRWKMWVSVLPIGGIEASWDSWRTLRGGARVSTLHHLGPLTIRVEDLAVAPTLAELERSSRDPFAPLD